MMSAEEWQRRAKAQIWTLSAPERCVMLWKWSWEDATTGLPHQQPQHQHVVAASAVSLLHMQQDDRQEPLLLSDIRGRPKQPSDLKHTPLKEAA